MINCYESEAIIKSYRFLNKKCEAIDRFIKNHALYFGPTCEEFGAIDVYSNILELMTRKNKLINFKLIVDDAINKLSDTDKKILYIKMNYNISVEEVCGILNLKERTVFRHIERAFSNFAEILNSSKHLKQLEDIISNEEWIRALCVNVKTHREAYKVKEVLINNL